MCIRDRANDIKDLIKRAKNGDKEAENEILNGNIALVWSVALKFSNRGYDLDDIFQIGCIGILKEIKNFDLSYDVRFSTYAVPLDVYKRQRSRCADGVYTHKNRKRACKS